MEDRYEIRFEDDLIKVDFYGREDIEVASRLWSDVIAACKEHDCRRVLGVARTTTPLTSVDSFQHADLWEKLGIDHRYRIAWVELNAHAVEPTRFAETVLSNRGLPGRLFDSEEAARDWLS